MNYGDICKAVKKINNKYCEPDPFRLCDDMGIELILSSLGTEDDAVKGFFFESCRIKTITINSDLPDIIQRIIVTHELGHAVLHRKGGIRYFHDAGLFDTSSIMENEANLFTAEYLLDDDDVMESLLDGYSFFETASGLYVPVELLDYKVRLMRWKGYEISNMPIDTRSNFLRDMEIPDCRGWWE